MLDRMLPSLVTLTLLLFLFLWALLIDFLIHLQKRASSPARDPGLERRKRPPSAALTGNTPVHSRLPQRAGLPNLR